jgi:hypothetical protein
VAPDSTPIRQLLLISFAVTGDGRLELEWRRILDGNAVASEGKQNDAPCLRDVHGRALVRSKEEKLYDREVGLGVLEERL